MVDWFVDTDLDKKENILADLKTTVETEIKRVNGYNTDLAFVDRQYIEEDFVQSGQYPGLFINDGTTDLVYQPGGTATATTSLTLVGYVYSEDGDCSTKLNAFAKDTVKAVMKDYTRSGYADSTYINQIITDEGILAPVGVFVMRLSIKYKIKKNV